MATTSLSLGEHWEVFIKNQVASGRYTRKTSGKAQRDTYLRALEERFAWLAQRPDLGRHRPEVGEGYYSYSHRSHVVFYLIRDGGIDIIGVPHQRMDVMNSVGSTAGLPAAPAVRTADHTTVPIS